MDKADICRQQRDREAKALKTYLKLSLLASAMLHGVALVVLLIRYGTQIELSQQRVAAPEAAPLEVSIVDSPDSSTNPGSGMQDGQSASELGAITFASSPDSAVATTASNPSTASDFPSPFKTDALTESAKSPAPLEKRQPEKASVDSAQPDEAAPHDNAQSPIAQSEPVSKTEPPSPTASIASPTAPSPGSVVASGNSASAVPSAGSIAANVVGKFLGFPSLPSPQPTNAVGGTSKTGIATGRSTSTSASRPAASLGTGAASLGGLVARNLENGLSGFFSNSKQQEQALCIVCTKPAYPVQAERMGITGNAQVSVDYDAQGNVTAVRLSRSSGHPELDQAALEEARKNWKFKPRQDGYRNFVVNIEFRAKDSNSPPATQSRSSQTASQPLRVPTPVRRPASGGQPSVHELMPEPAEPNAAETPAQDSRSPVVAPQPPAASVETTPSVSTLDSDKPFVVPSPVITGASEPIDAPNKQ